MADGAGGAPVVEATTRKTSWIRRSVWFLAIFAVIAVVILVAIIGIMHFANADRSWQEYIGAGDRALERGNYDWAEKMYREALQYAQGKGAKDPLVAETRKYLKRLEKARAQEKGR